MLQCSATHWFCRCVRELYIVSVVAIFPFLCIVHAFECCLHCQIRCNLLGGDKPKLLFFICRLQKRKFMGTHTHTRIVRLCDVKISMRLEIVEYFFFSRWHDLLHCVFFLYHFKNKLELIVECAGEGKTKTCQQIYSCALVDSLASSTLHPTPSLQSLCLF